MGTILGRSKEIFCKITRFFLSFSKDSPHSSLKQSQDERRGPVPVGVLDPIGIDLDLAIDVVPVEVRTVRPGLVAGNQLVPAAFR